MPKITVVPVGGLGNRLLAVLSALRLARHRGYDLHVHWLPSDDLYCNWEDLFESGYGIGIPGSASDVEADRSWDAYRQRDQGTPLIPFPTEGDFRVVANTVFLDDHETRFGDRHDGPELLEFAGLLESLKIKSEILDAVDYFVSLYGVRRRVGLHVRQGYGEAARHAGHVSWMRTFTVDDYIDLGNSAKSKGFAVHLCSDDPDAMMRIRNAVDASTVGIRNWEKSTDVSAVQDALVDLLVLSKANSVTSIYGSTFSWIASVLGQMPLQTLLLDAEGKRVLDCTDFSRYENGRAKKIAAMF